MNCPKCKKNSGDDWSQCKGICPIEGSPHYNAVYKLYEEAFEEWYWNILDMSINWSVNHKNPFSTATQRQIARDPKTKAELRRSWFDKILAFEEPELHKKIFPYEYRDEDSDYPADHIPF